MARPRKIPDDEKVMCFKDQSASSEMFSSQSQTMYEDGWVALTAFPLRAGGIRVIYVRHPEWYPPPPEVAPKKRSKKRAKKA